MRQQEKPELPSYVQKLAGAKLGSYQVKANPQSGLPIVLGEGASSYVLEALGPLDYSKAVKFLKREFAQSPGARSRFHEEIEKLKRVRHPNVIAIEAVGEHPIDEITLPYYVMEYVDGEPLERWADNQQKAGRFLPPASVCSLIRQILDALAYVHAKSVFHLDLKPPNVLVTSYGVVKILDFGLAQVVAPDLSGYAPEMSLSRMAGREFRAMHPRFRLLLGTKFSIQQLEECFDLYGMGYSLSRVGTYLVQSLDPTRRYLFDAIVLRLTVAEPKHTEYESGTRFSTVELDVPEYIDARDVYDAIEKLENPRHHYIAVPELQMATDPVPPVRISGGIHVPTTARVRNIIDTPVFQRLRWVNQLAMVHLVYPGALHTRFEHSLGCYYYTLRYVRRLLEYPYFVFHFSKEDLVATLLAALIHDLGHYPMAHAIQDSQELKLPAHEIVGDALLVDRVRVQGDESTLWNLIRQEGGVGTLRNLIKQEWGVDPQRVAEIAFRSKDERDYDARRHNLLHSIIDGPLDSDKMHYLQLDSIHTGNPTGRQFDAEQLINSLAFTQDFDGIAVSEKGLAAVESFLYARYRMHIDVYWHHTVRAARKMIARAIDYYIRDGVGKTGTDSAGARREKIRVRATRLTDREFLEWLLHEFPSVSDSGRLIRHLLQEEGRRLEDREGELPFIKPVRQIFKRVRTYWDDPDDGIRSDIFHHLSPSTGGVEDVLNCEKQIAQKFSAELRQSSEPWEIIVDIPRGAEARWRPITVWYPKQAGGTYKRLETVSAVAKEIAQDFGRNAQKIRVYCSPRVKELLLKREVELNRWVKDALTRA